MIDAPAGFDSDFTPELCDHFVELLKSAYARAASCYELAAPYADGNTVGTDLYRFAGNMLTELAEQRPDLVQVVKLHPGFCHRAGRYELRCHRVASGHASIYSSFPGTDTQAVATCASMYLPGMEPAESPEPSVVLAHMGNERSKLISAHLCIPVPVEGDRIEWGYVKTIYAADAVQSQPSPPHSPPPAADIEPAVVRRRVRKFGP